MVRPSRFSRLHLLEQVLHHQRREPFRRLVEQQQLGIAHQGAADGQHLLLAAGEVAALPVGQLAQLREQREHRVDRPAARPAGGARRHVEVLPHRELGEDAPVLRHEADAGARDAERRPAGDVLPFPDDAARASAASGP